jgi:hypothetical protein
MTVPAVLPSAFLYSVGAPECYSVVREP